jgi:hypothetical protein
MGMKEMETLMHSLKNLVKYCSMEKYLQMVILKDSTMD